MTWGMNFARDEFEGSLISYFYFKALKENGWFSLVFLCVTTVSMAMMAEGSGHEEAGQRRIGEVGRARTMCLRASLESNQVCLLPVRNCVPSLWRCHRQTDRCRETEAERNRACSNFYDNICLSLSPKSVKNNKTLCWTWPCTNSSCYMSPTTSMNLMNPQVTLSAEKVTEPARKPPYKLRAHRGPFNQFFRE